MQKAGLSSGVSFNLTMIRTLSSSLLLTVALSVPTQAEQRATQLQPNARVAIIGDSITEQ